MNKHADDIPDPKVIYHHFGFLGKACALAPADFVEARFSIFCLFPMISFPRFV